MLRYVAARRRMSRCAALHCSVVNTAARHLDLPAPTVCCRCVAVVLQVCCSARHLDVQESSTQTHKNRIQCVAGVLRVCLQVCCGCVVLQCTTFRCAEGGTHIDAQNLGLVCCGCVASVLQFVAVHDF